MDTNKYPKPFVTVDVLIFTIEDSALKILLVKRANEPYVGQWAIPGGFVNEHESLEEAAKRILIDKTGVSDVYLEQLYTFGEPKRDPRGRVITVSYFALIPFQDLQNINNDKVSEVSWFDTKKTPVLAFDHSKILEYALSRLKTKAGYSNIVYGLLPDKFKLSDLQKVYEIILGQPLDKRNFRKRMLGTELLAETGEKQQNGAHRPAMLYEFKKKEVVFFD